jgi:hypothetical protein
MAFSASGLYLATFVDVLDTTQLALDLDLETHKVALYTNTLTPNFSTDAAYSATNEVGASGTYASGGNVLTGTNVSESPTSVLMWDGDDWSVTGATITARGAIVYADALAGNNLIVGVTFGSDFTSTAGTFTIQWNSLGIFTIDLF